METSNGLEDFRKRSVVVICRAGSDRSKYIAEELSQRGYNATHGGTMEGHNYITKEDLSYAGSIIFASIHEKNQFDSDKSLKEYVKNNDINIFVMNITESDKNRAHDSNKLQELRGTISEQLDSIGFRGMEKSQS